MAVLDELSFQEKSALISLLAVLLVFGGYFGTLLGGGGPHDLDSMLWRGISLVIAVVIIQVIFHIAASVADVKGAQAGEDERDRLISGRASAVSYLVLSVGVLIVLVRLLIGGAMDETVEAHSTRLFEFANLLLFVFVLSEIVHYGSRLFFYRRGV